MRPGPPQWHLYPPDPDGPLPLAGLDGDPPATSHQAGRRQSPDGGVQIFADGGEVGGDAQTFSDLLAGLRSADRAARRRAARGLGEFDDIRAVPNLLVSLDDPEWIAREAALWALGQIAPRIRDLDAMPGLTHLLADPQWVIRRVAAWALGRLADRRAAPALLPLLDDAYSPVREAAAWALGQIGDEAAVPRLADAVRDASQNVGQRAVEALGLIGGDTALRGLMAGLRDGRAAVRCSAVRALGSLGDMRAFTALLPLLHSPEPDMRIAAADGLAALAERADNLATRASTYQALLDVWSDPRGDPEVRRVVGEAMARVHQLGKL